MNSTQIQSIHFKAKPSLKERIKQKVSTLSKYSDKIKTADIFLKMNNGGKLSEKEVVLRIQVPNMVLTSSATALTFEHAVNSASQSMKRKLVNYNKRLKAKRK